MLPRNISTLVKNTVTKDSHILVRISPFQDKTRLISLANMVEINAAISSLYTDNIKIQKEKGFNSYHQVEQVLLWYINTIGCYRQLALTYFMCSTAFDRELNINNSCYDICLCRTNAKDLNNVRDKIPTFKLYDITEYLFLCYLTTKKYKLQQIKLE